MSSSPNDQQALLAFFARSFTEDISLLAGEPNVGAYLSSRSPLEIDDLNGEPLFLDFAILNATGDQIGIIRSSARGESLPLIDSIALGPQYFDPANARAAAVAQVPNDLPNSTIQSATFVCYGYPRIGVLVKCSVHGQPWSLVYDAALAGALVRKWQGSVPERRSEAGPLQASLEGVPFYSYLDRIRGDQSEGGISDPEGTNAQWTALRVAKSNLDAPKDIRPLAAFEKETTDSPVPGKTKVSIRGTLLPTRQIGQQTPVYCAVASIQMILDYLGISNLTQAQIAHALQTTDVGTTNPNIIAGIATLTRGQWAGRVTTNPTFEQNVSLMEALIPAKSGIPGHARVLRGWREYCIINQRGDITLREQFYIINDPYPLASGQLVLESVSTPIANFYTNTLSVSRTSSLSSTDGTAEGAGITITPSRDAPTRIHAINSRSFTITLPNGMSVVPGETVPPALLELLAAFMRAVTS